jgi:hypothetical protein
MRFPTLTVAGLLALLSCPALCTAGEGKAESYKWTDANGTLHYGDRIPVEATARERAVLNSQGVPIRELGAQKTPQQLAEEARRDAEAAQQKQHDVFLLTTYATAKDIEQLRDLRLDQMEAQLTAGWQYVDTLEGRLRALQARAFAYRPYTSRPGATKMPDDLTEELVRTLNESRTQRASLESKRVEKEKVREQFESDIARYREIKVARAAP